MTDLVEKYNSKMPQSSRYGLNTYLERGFDIGVGEFSYGVPSLHWSEGDKLRFRLRIGTYCSIAPQVSIYVGTQGIHTLDFVSTYPLGMVFGTSRNSDKTIHHEGDLSVYIGSDVWIGRDVIVQAGVNIGHGAVIGTRAVVTNDVEPYSIVTGVPARSSRKRFRDDQIARFLELKWWDWSPKVVKNNLDIFFRRDIDKALDEMEKISQI